MDLFFWTQFVQMCEGLEFGGVCEYENVAESDDVTRIVRMPSSLAAPISGQFFPSDFTPPGNIFGGGGHYITPAMM